MSGRFEGKVAIVAGSARGIGLATGRRLKLRAKGLDVSGVAANLSAADTPTRLVDGALDSDDVAEVIAFLCLPESRQITGQTIHTSAGNVV